MKILEILLISIGLAMDAFAVSICKGLSMKRKNLKKAIIIGGYFGFFQMIMPIIGYLLGYSFSGLVENIDHWIAFGLLCFIGGKMIIEAFGEEESADDKTDFKTMLGLAVATSIDALAIGITYAFLDPENSMIAFIIIGIVTFILSVLGVKIGNKFGDEFESKAEFIGGIILVGIGIKILLEHLLS